MIQVLGYLGAAAFAISGVPIAVGTYKLGKTDVSMIGILLILFGSVSMFLYEALTSAKTPTLIDFAVCALSWLVVLRYKLKPRLIKEIT